MNTDCFSTESEQAVLFPALEQSMMAVILTDEHDKVLFFNPAAERLWGYSREDVLGRNVNILVPAELQKRHPGFIRHNREGKRNNVMGMNRELLITRSDGEHLWTSFILSKTDVSGRVFYLAMARDVTKEVQGREQNQQLLLAMAYTDQPVIVLSTDFTVVQANRAFTELFGGKNTEVIGRSIKELLFIGQSGEGDNILRFTSLLHAGQQMMDELQVVDSGGRDVWVRVSATPVSHGSGHTDWLIMTFTDVTENQKVRFLEKDILLMLADDPPFSVAGETLCRKAEALLPGVRVSLYRQAEETLLLWATGATPAISETGDKVKEFRRTWPVRFNDNPQAGMLVLTFGDDPGNSRFVDSVAESCTWFSSLALEQEHRRQQIEHLQQFDVLTGLPARKRLHQYLDRLLKDKPECIAIFCLGLDNFSRVNEVLGYAAADRLLLALVERLREAITPELYLSRTEGAQFVIVAPGYDADAASRFACDLKHFVPEPVISDDGAISLTISTGISLWSGSEGRDTLLAAARSAMEHLRDNGGDGWQFYDPEVNIRIKEELRIGVALKKAIAQEKLVLYYQPQVYADSGELYGVEALARWSDPVFGMVSPVQFVAIAEKTGESGRLACWVLKEACRQMSEWRHAGLRVRNVSVNLSPEDFRDPFLPDMISGFLEQYGLPGECLTIEVTENAMMDMSECMVARLNAIRACGVGLSVDDFGTGFSGLLSLARLPVTEIKIDKSFIDDVTTEPRARALTEAMTGIGHSLGLTIIAEGVESPQQLDLLRQLRCPVIQGYLFSPPLPPQQLDIWIRQQHEGHHNQL